MDLRIFRVAPRAAQFVSGSIPRAMAAHLGLLYHGPYDLLRTIEEIFHTGTLHHHDDVARVIDGIWKK